MNWTRRAQQTIQSSRGWRRRRSRSLALAIINTQAEIFLETKLKQVMVTLVLGRLCEGGAARGGNRESAVSLVLLWSCNFTASARRSRSRRQRAETAPTLRHRCSECWAAPPVLVLSSLPAPPAEWFSSPSPLARPCFSLPPRVSRWSGFVGSSRLVWMWPVPR